MSEIDNPFDTEANSEVDNVNDKKDNNTVEKEPKTETGVSSTPIVNENNNLNRNNIYNNSNNNNSEFPTRMRNEDEDEDDLHEQEREIETNNNEDDDDEEEDVDPTITAQDNEIKLEISDDKLDFSQVEPEVLINVDKRRLLTYLPKDQIKHLKVCPECHYLNVKSSNQTNCKNCEAAIPKENYTYFGMIAFNDMNAESYMLKLFRTNIGREKSPMIPGLYAMHVFEDKDEN